MKPEWNEQNKYIERFTMEEWNQLEDGKRDIKRYEQLADFISYIIHNFTITTKYQTDLESLSESYFEENEPL